MSNGSEGCEGVFVEEVVGEKQGEVVEETGVIAYYCYYCDLFTYYSIISLLATNCKK